MTSPINPQSSKNDPNKIDFNKSNKKKELNPVFKALNYLKESILNGLSLAEKPSELKKIIPEDNHSPLHLEKCISRKLGDLLVEDVSKIIEESKTEINEGSFIQEIGFEVHPYLIFIAKQRHLENKKLAENLINMPLSHSECDHINQTLLITDTSFKIEPEDIKIFVYLCSKIYQQIANDPDNQYAFVSYARNIDKKIDSIKFEDQIIKDLLTFNGIKLKTIDLNYLAGNVSKHTYIEIANIIKQCKYLSLEDRDSFSDSLRMSFDQSLLTEKTIEKIKRGEFVTLPVGYISLIGGHSITLVFINNEFVICNRGDSFGDTRVIKRFSYEKDKLNLDVLKYLMVTSREVTKTPKEGAVNQYLQLELVLPKILNATRIDEDEYISFKAQKTSNCSKASPLTAIKIGVYLKLIKHFSHKDASIIAKNIGDEISTELRKKTIKQARDLLIKTEPNNFFDFLNQVDLDKIKRITKTEHSDRIREATSSDHPLLLIIAKQRSKLKEKWKVDNLIYIPLNYYKCRYHIGELSNLKITISDELIFKYLSAKINKINLIFEVIIKAEEKLNRKILKKHH